MFLRTFAGLVGFLSSIENPDVFVARHINLRAILIEPLDVGDALVPAGPRRGVGFPTFVWFDSTAFGC